MIRLEVSNVTVKITDSVINEILNFKQDSANKSESGGILLGYSIDDSIFTITDITTPSAFDKSSRYNFIRNRKSAQKAINKLFKESGGKKIYLGEWHTHPENVPSPSFLDKNSIIEQVKYNRLNSNVIFMIIVGNSALYISSVKAEGIISAIIVQYTEIEKCLTFDDVPIPSNDGTNKA
jgi:integrative and conjugative element protein (TIGR02256 family)